ncbi:MAG TPA: alpha-glucosidase C-terminal domain-containing protein, partial [Chitinophagaceae bacterium]|nr:alpha-glucosidase C-terminal domain-containing protein [Chitinophagaceae bacterium]
KAKGGDLKRFLEGMKISSRDNGRTPMQWDTTLNAGFGSGTPWLPVNGNYTTVNVAAQEKDPNSCLNYFRAMQKLRKENEVLVYGKYSLLDKDNPAVFAYTREWKGKKWLVLLNFKDKTTTVNTGFDLSKAMVKMHNYTTVSTNGTLKPYEAVIYEL